MCLLLRSRWGAGALLPQLTRARQEQESAEEALLRSLLDARHDCSLRENPGVLCQ
jgi:hypothetical protein